jgi:hypothetical protein
VSGAVPRSGASAAVRGGRRRAVPEPTRRRRLTASPRLVAIGWSVVALCGLAATLVEWTPLALPAWLAPAGAVTVTTAYAFALALRAGGRPVLCALLALLLGAAAVVSQVPVLLAGAAVSTAVLGAVLAVLATTPAARFLAVAREVGIAAGVGAVAAFAANAYDATVSTQRAGYLVLGLSLLGALALAFRLAAGLQTLGRRGTVMLVGGLALLAVSLAYSEALSRWGTPEVLGQLTRTTADLRATIGAVPRPIEFLVGYPALAWGVSSRARRRQGWWGTGFGAAGLAVVTVTLLNRELALTEAGLGLVYSLAIGLVLGFLVIRADTFLSGARGRRARRAEEASAHRPEPGRLRPLM